MLVVELMPVVADVFDPRSPDNAGDVRSDRRPAFDFRASGGRRQTPSSRDRKSAQGTISWRNRRRIPPDVNSRR